MKYNKKTKTFEIELWRIYLFCFSLLILMISCMLLIYEVEKIDKELFLCENNETIELLKNQDNSNFYELDFNELKRIIESINNINITNA